MKHKCRCDPTFTGVWTNAQLQAWHEAHDGSMLRLGKRYEVVNKKRLDGKHDVRFVEVPR